MTLTLMGTGTSNGIPVPGCDCAVCRSEDPRDRRHRCSALFQDRDINVVVDTGPEFRIQALAADLKGLDAVLWTHDHADHLHGLDDLRPFTYQKILPGYASPETCREIENRFDYLWKHTQTGGGKARIDLQTLGHGETALVGHLEFIPIPVLHGRLPVWGWRCGETAYLTDVSRIPQSSYSLLENLDVLVIGALRERPHETHFSVEEALKEVKKIRPERAYLTHICHEVGHRDLASRLPPGVEPAFDGLRLRIRD